MGSNAIESLPPARFVRISHLSKVRQCEQVAAVCYRVRSESIDFLLVRTRGSGRWTFPKGCTERGLTHAQAAALEAFEEAGVHGRIEEASFGSYVCRKGKDVRKSAPRANTLHVQTHLCQVLRLTKPKEANRDRTWFSVRHARRALREERDPAEAAQFVRVIDKAVARIRRAYRVVEIASEQTSQLAHNDPLRKVQFEIAVDLRNLLQGASATSIPAYRFREPEPRAARVPGTERKILLGEVLEFTAEKKAPSLGMGSKSR